MSIRGWIRAIAVLVLAVSTLPLAVGTAASGKEYSGSMSSIGSYSKGPIGWDIYRDLDQLPQLPVGVSTDEFSSFDRTGGNDDGFSGTYSCLRHTPAGCVIAEHQGPGEIDAMWFVATLGGVNGDNRIDVELDGRHVVDAPIADLVNGKLGPPFVYPLVANGAQSSGGVYIRVPMPFRESMRVTVTQNPQFYHVTYSAFADANGVSTFDPSDKALDVIAKLKAAGTADPKPAAPGASTTNRSFTLAPGQRVQLADLQGPGSISQLQLHIPQLQPPSASSNANDPAVLASNDVLQNTRLRISFDGNQTVDAPLGQFFGSGLGLTQVKALMYAMDPSAKTMTSWWPMPYLDRATVELYNGSSHAITAADSSVTSAPDPSVAQQLSPSGDSGYFRATANGGPTTPGQDYAFLHTGGWGKFVGVTESMVGPASRAYLEGDERVYVDGSHTPQMHGTGTEDFYDGAYYFANGPFTNPFTGNPAHQVAEFGCADDCTGAYRLMIADAVPFHSQIQFGIEHGAADDVQAEYASTAYWYGRTQEAQLTSDTLDVGNQASEAAHHYTSSDPGPVTTLTDTFEGNDGPPQPVTSTLRDTTAPVNFQMAVDPGNDGVTLRRMSDQANGYQSAEVYVDGHDVGTWLETLANPYHRWLDDSFQIPVSLTGHRRALDLRLVPTAGSPAWSAARYKALSLVRPFTDRQPPSRVTGLTAKEDGSTNQITLSWQPVTDNVSVDHYNIYASTTADFRLGPATLVGTSPTTTFTDTGLGLHQTGYFRVAAVDEAGNIGPVSAPASAPTGDTLHLEAESLLPPVSATAPEIIQGNCCGVTWSNNAQVLFLAAKPGDYMTVAFNVPTSGIYDLTAVQTMAVNYGINTLAVDKTQVGEPSDTYSPNVAVTPPIDYGQVPLTTGRHTLTLTVTDRNPSSIGYLAGLDYFNLRLVSPTGA